MSGKLAPNLSYVGTECLWTATMWVIEEYKPYLAIFDALFMLIGYQLLKKITVKLDSWERCMCPLGNKTTDCKKFSALDEECFHISRTLTIL